MLTLATADVKILDYTNSQIVTLNAGVAKLQTGTFKIIHIIETDEYQELIDSMRITVSQNISEHHFLRPFLIHEITEIQGYLDRLKPKMKRSLNFIGSAWKWIAGNPDHDDFEIITQKTNRMLANNNKQVVINKMSLEKINELTATTNEIIKHMNYNETTKEKLITNLRLKISILKEEIVNIQYAMHWAKLGIVNSFILSSNEINIVNHVINRDSLPFVNIEQAFEFAEIKIASNSNSLVYIINIPTTDEVSCNKLLIKPIKFGKVISKLTFKNVLTCNRTIFGIRNDCKNYNNITICNNANLEILNNDNCLVNLIKSKPSNCSVIDNRHIPTIEEISPGTIFFNQFNGTIYINGEPQKLLGTYVLQFHNATVTILDKAYNFFETTNLQPLPAILKPAPSSFNLEETLSLEIIKELQVNNTVAIDLLRNNNKWSLTASFGLSSLAISSLIIILIKSGLLRRKKELVITPPIINSCSTNTHTHFSMPELSEIQRTEPPGIQRISHIPYF